MNFRWSVLGSIDASDSESGRIFKAFFEIYKILTPSHRDKTKICLNFDVGAVQESVIFVDLEIVMLKNAPILAIGGVDTAENEPLRV